MSRRINGLVAAAVCLAVGAGALAQDAGASKQRPALNTQPAQFADGRVLVKLRADSVQVAARAKGPIAGNLPGVLTLTPLSANGALVASKHKQASQWFAADLTPGTDVATALDTLRDHPDVELVEPDYITPSPTPMISNATAAVPNDPGANQQYALERIQAYQAWDVHRGSPEVVVAVIDSGVMWDHPDLAQNMWVNTREIPNNGIDDDGNGYADDVFGWDFAGGDNDPRDDRGADTQFHGTHVAGIIAAIQDNNVGIAGTANVRIMALRVFDGPSGARDSDIIAALEYAARNGAKVINMSFGGSEVGQARAETHEAVARNDVVQLAATGNESRNVIGFPAAFQSVIAVGATDQNDRLADFSNTGQGTEIVAPGVAILSTVGVGEYANLDGTSMATPYAAGVAALIRSANPTMTAEQVRARLSGTADDLGDAGYDTLTGYGRINAYRALTQSGGTAPPPPGGPGRGGQPNPNDDAAEPNNSPAEAKLVQPGTYELMGLDEDWFGVEIPQPGTLTVSINGPQGDLDLFILDSNLNFVAESMSETSHEQIVLPTSDPKYYIVVAPYEGMGSAYTMTVKLDTTPVRGPGFPNDPGYPGYPNDPGFPGGSGETEPVFVVCGSGTGLPMMAMLAGLFGVTATRRRFGRRMIAGRFSAAE